jgi:hypothetical protein
MKEKYRFTIGWWGGSTLQNGLGHASSQLYYEKESKSFGNKNLSGVACSVPPMDRRRPM